MNKIFTSEAHATSGRAGKVISDDGALDLQLAVPKELGGPGGHGTNPEQLFAAGYSACFGGALGLVAGQQKLKTGPFTVTAHVTLGKKGEGPSASRSRSRAPSPSWRRSRPRRS